MKRDFCVLLRPMRFVGTLALGFMTTSCFYVWQEPIRYGQMGRPGSGGPEQGSPQPGTLDALQAERENQVTPETGTYEAVPAPRETAAPPRPSPPRQESKSVPVARRVPGREGFVFSPYNNKLIDVKGFPTGALMRDPHYPASEDKFFKVP